jgi:hypothetical protein
MNITNLRLEACVVGFTTSSRGEKGFAYGAKKQ